MLQNTSSKSAEIFGNVRVVNTLRLRQNGRHFPGDIFKWIFLNETAWISIKLSQKFVPDDPIKKIPALVQIMAWCRSGDRPSSEQMMVRLLTHICVSRPQWVKTFCSFNKVFAVVLNIPHVLIIRLLVVIENRSHSEIPFITLKWFIRGLLTLERLIKTKCLSSTVHVINP